MNLLEDDTEEDEAAAMAEWAATASEEEAKELDQSEIDNLLGFDSGDIVKETKGIKAMIDRAMDSYERLPMLEVVFEKFIRLLSTSLRNLTEDNVELNIRNISSLRFGNYINMIPMPALVTIFKAVEWDHYGLFIADNQLIFSLVDILFGGKKNNKHSKTEGRAYTSIEQGVVRQLVGIALTDLKESFESLSPVHFTFERMEYDPRFASIARHGDSAILIQIDVDMEDRKGGIEILFPYDALEPVRELLLQVFVGEQFGTDKDWVTLLRERIMSTELEVEAIIEGRASSIKDIANLKVGNTVLLESSPDDDISLVCKGKTMLTGKLGKQGSKIAVSVNESAKEHKYRSEKA
jgi:flagellar motor switch protein FliM